MEARNISKFETSQHKNWFGKEEKKKGNSFAQKWSENKEKEKLWCL